MMKVRKKRKLRPMERYATMGIFSRAKPRKQLFERDIKHKYSQLRYCGWLKLRNSMPDRLK